MPAPTMPCSHAHPVQVIKSVNINGPINHWGINMEDDSADHLNINLMIPIWTKI